MPQTTQPPGQPVITQPPGQPVILAAISLGGMVGASTRHGLDLLWPTTSGTLPWATLLVNASGCFLIGVLMAVLGEVARPHPLLRSFLGIGVLGGYTTFSTYAVQVDALLREGYPLVALAYLAGTVLAALASVVAGTVAGRGLRDMRTRRAGVAP